MLTLNRKAGEGIMIGNNIRVLVKRVVGGQVYLSIAAPKDVSVHRDEIYRRMGAESLAGRSEDV